MTNTIHIDNNNALIEAMAIYLNSIHTPPELGAAERLVGAEKLRRICIALLSWLKSMARLPRMKAMKISEAGTASSELVLLFSEGAGFSSTFSIAGNEITLHPDLNQETINNIANTADRVYQPPRFISQRRKAEDDATRN